VSNRSGSVSITEDTPDGLEHLCIEELPEGDYNVSVAVPDGFNPTTTTNRALALRAGDISYLDFGAQANSQTLAEEPTPEGSGKSPLLVIIGGVILIAGLGLGIFAGRYMRG
jgi:hypothetical protein